MKAFTMPEIEVQRFAIEDVITTSTTIPEENTCPNDVCPFD